MLHVALDELRAAINAHDAILTQWFSFLLDIQSNRQDLWAKLVAEIDRENPQRASDYLAGVIKAMQEFSLSALLPHLPVLLVAMHNAFGCVEVPSRQADSIAQHIPCTQYHFGVRYSHDRYGLVFLAILCPHKAKANAAQTKSVR